MSQTPYPDFIQSFPQVDMPLEGVKAYLLNQPGLGQAVFFDLPAGAVIPQHSHDAQWGIVIEGELDLNLNGEIERRKKGDSYFIPQGVEHGASIVTDAKVLEVFTEERWKAKA